MRCTSKLAPSQRRGIPADSNRPPSAMRCSIWATNRPTDAPRRTSENDAGRPADSGATRPSRIRRARSLARSPVARTSPAANASRSHAASAAAASGSPERAIDAIGSTISGIHASASSPSRTSSATSSRNPIGSPEPTGPCSSRSQRAAVNASASPASGSTTRLARWTTVSQPRTTAIAGTSVGSAQAPMRAGSWGTATRIDDRCPTGSTIDPGGSSSPLIGTSAGGRSVRTRAPANATANGSGDSFSTSITVSPPRSGTDHTRCTASPSGIRTRVSITAVPSRRCWRTAGSEAGTCQRSSAATYHDTVASGP